MTDFEAAGPGLSFDPLYTVTSAFQLDPGPAARMAAALDLDNGTFRLCEPLPAAWHWLYGQAVIRARELGPDGRGGADGLLPRLDGRARMWAGTDIAFEVPLRFGVAYERNSRVVALDEKKARSGSLKIAVVEHRIVGPDGPCLVERQTLVFRPPSVYKAPANARQRSRSPDWTRVVSIDEVLLFQFSAATHNAHRIHYDLPYAREREGYPALVVHGTLTAILLLDLLTRARPEARVTHFSCRAERALFAGQEVTLAGAVVADDRVDLWAEGPDGDVAMTAAATLAQ
ncbi:MAG: acyl-CoA dehydrogenase [Hyphomicrobium sp.]|nr:acyl-CoA dehydrogenase [Hyphomicrobium sp.]